MFWKCCKAYSVNSSKLPVQLWSQLFSSVRIFCLFFWSTLWTGKCFHFNTAVTVFFFSLFFAVILFCMAALIFPIGFYINEVGGQPYKLPNNTVVGSSYVLFVLSIFFTIVGLLFAGKVCLPGWWMSGLQDFILEKSKTSELHSQEDA